ncbi:MAG: polysaccharide biosynthesis/export family protein [Candidatus Acidiferrales bacterium]
MLSARTSIRQISTSLLIASALFVTSGSMARAYGQASSATNSKSASDDSKKTGSPAAGRAGDSTMAPAPGDTYRIGIDDQIQISVWREHDLSLSVVVRPDGVITMPLLNDIYVVGMTPEELAAALTLKLKTYVNEPQVTVSVQAIHSRKVYLIGEAAKQGSFPLNDRKTVLELLTEAGGIGQFAKGNSIYVLRLVNGKEERIPFHYKAVIAGKGQDVELMPGDKVIVP